MKNIVDFIITQTPYRISLGGGGTDLPFYSNERGGELITAAINQYMTVSIASRPLDDKILVQTTDVQFCEKLDDISNNIVKESLRYFNLSKAIQVATYSTIPSGIGLGTSSTLMVGLVNGLSMFAGQKLSKMDIGFIAHHIEREILGMEGGVQDQYIAAFGGIQILQIDTLGKVKISPLAIDMKNQHHIQEHLVLVYTGDERDSHDIVNSQKSDLRKTMEVYDKIKAIGRESVKFLIEADIEGLGKAMDRHWNLKRSISKQMSSNKFDEMYISLKKLGSPGGKIIGAGGGGFFLMTVPGDVNNYKNKIKALGYRFFDWRFENHGSRIIDT